MPQQSPLRIVKRWKRYLPKDKEGLSEIPPMTRGFYVLYNQETDGHYEVTYIGISGLGNKTALGGRIRSHAKRKKGWTHFSFFEVHDNISGEEIRELEGLLLAIFCDDKRIELSNVQTGSGKFSKARSAALWK
jgi:hypothetical protein